MEDKINLTVLPHINMDKKKIARSFHTSDSNPYSSCNIPQNTLRNTGCLYLLRGDLLRLLGDRLRRRGVRDLLLMGDRDLLLDGDHLLGGLTSLDRSRLDKMSSLVRVLQTEEQSGSKNQERAENKRVCLL